MKNSEKILHKKRIINIFCVVIFVTSILATILVTNPIHAHDSDYFSGTYDNANATCNTNNMKFFITTSAQNSILDSSVYNAATDWNSISSKVNVSNIVLQVSGMPNLNGFNYVYGSTYYDGTLGETIPYNDSDIANVNDSWTSVTIYMNSSSSAFPNKTAAKKTFMHEVGHVFKMKHPLNSTYAHGPLYYGYPKAIMNQGLPNNAEVSSTIQSHDKSNLISKWGK